MKRLDIYPARPFIKWVGGKTQLLEDIKKTLPQDLSHREEMTYVEPFVGGGAVLFWILQEYPNITRAIINDINAELICTYRVIKSDVENLIVELTRIQSEYLALDEAARKNYYLSQREHFNEGNNSEIETAALFIFLNRTCFNGLYRVNSKGEFNVPHGKYSNPRICDEETLRADSAVLQRVEILCGDFAQTGKYAGDNVLYYLILHTVPLRKLPHLHPTQKTGLMIRSRCGCVTFVSRLQPINLCLLQVIPTRKMWIMEMISLIFFTECFLLSECLLRE